MRGRPENQIENIFERSSARTGATRRVPPGGGRGATKNHLQKNTGLTGGNKNSMKGSGSKSQPRRICKRDIVPPKLRAEMRTCVQPKNHNVGFEKGGGENTIERRITCT